MKIVYRIRQEGEKYQYFLPESPSEHVRFEAVCKPLRDTWQPPSIFIYEPMLEQGDFYQSSSAYLILSPKAVSNLSDYFSEFGEVLPLFYRGETYGFINILKCYDCLDYKNTQWWTGLEGLLPSHYVFDPRRLPFPGPFKIPQTAGGEILVYVNTIVPEQDDMRELIAKHNLKGLVFEELWRDE